MYWSPGGAEAAKSLTYNGYNADTISGEDRVAGNDHLLGDGADELIAGRGGKGTIEGDAGNDSAPHCEATAHPDNSY